MMVVNNYFFVEIQDRAIDLFSLLLNSVRITVSFIIGVI